MATFVLNDETVVNSYGFRVRNAGINLDRFRANPVMLDQHWNSTGSVLGRWKNIRVEGSRLLADDEFDMEDDQAKKIQGKVDRGIIKAASMGISFDREQMKLQPDGNFDLMTCELFEASIVAIPSNASALRLYASAGEPLPEAEIKLAINAITKNQITDMKKIALSIVALAALGMTSQPSEDEVSLLSAAIEKLKADLDKEKTAREKAEGELTKLANAQAEALINDALTSGKLMANVKDEFLKMALNNYELAAKVIGGMPSKKSLAASVQNTGANEIKTVEDFQKLSLNEQLAFKTEQPEAYKKLFA